MTCILLMITILAGTTFWNAHKLRRQGDGDWKGWFLGGVFVLLFFGALLEPVL